MAGYVWRAKRDLRGGVKIPPVLTEPVRTGGLSAAAKRDWADYMKKNARANREYNNRPETEAGQWSVSSIAAMVKKKQAIQRGR